MEFRHEWKHEISYSDLLALRARLGAVLEGDQHAVNGSYQIRSLYFDNLADKALREKLDGVNSREKFRIRYYNSGLCSKEQARMSWEEVQAVAGGDVTRLADSKEPLVRELCFKMTTQGLRPRTIVDYTREPFVYDPGNVRVTLDYNIRTAMGNTDFLNPDCVTIPAGDAPAILEVKWDGFLPSLIRDLAQVPRTHTSAFSKYAACRIYG